MTILPQDMYDRPIPALRLKPGAAQTLSAGATSVRTTQFSDTTRVVSLYATVPVFVRFGGSTVTAASSDHYFPEGLYYDFAIGGDESPQYRYVAVIRASTDGTVYVSEKE